MFKIDPDPTVQIWIRKPSHANGEPDHFLKYMPIFGYSKRVILNDAEYQDLHRWCSEIGEDSFYIAWHPFDLEQCGAKEYLSSYQVFAADEIDFVVFLAAWFENVNDNRITKQKQFSSILT